MKTLGYLLAGYALLMVLAGSPVSQAVHHVLMSHMLHYLHVDSIMQAFLVMLP